MCEKAVKKSLFAIIHVPDQHKTQQIREKVISENTGMLQFIPNHNKLKKCVKMQLIIIFMH